MDSSPMIPRALDLLQRTPLSFGNSVDTRRHRALARISGAVSDLLGTCALPEEEALRSMAAQLERTLQGTILAIVTDVQVPVASRRELFPVAIEKAFNNGLLSGGGRDDFLVNLEAFLRGEVSTMLRLLGHFNDEELRIAYETVSLILLNQRFGTVTHEGWMRLSEDFLAAETDLSGLLLRICRLRCLLLKRRLFADMRGDEEIAAFHEECVAEGMKAVQSGAQNAPEVPHAWKKEDWRIVEGLYLVLCENFMPEADWRHRLQLIDFLRGLDHRVLSKAETTDTGLLYESFTLETQMRAEMMARCGM